MEDQFSKYSLRIFSNLNKTVLNKMATLENKELDKSIANLMQIENKFTDIENKLDKTINKMVIRIVILY